tara:strand:- start:167 stop:343 length:177 start_codon:yes stop_codon:yes gene_type:complete
MKSNTVNVLMLALSYEVIVLWAQCQFNKLKRSKHKAERVKNFFKSNDLIYSVIINYEG